MKFDSGHTHSGFSLGFSHAPRSDFAIFAEGYHRAARRVAEALLGQGHFPDYEAYPVVFLYRHALELNLKNIVYKAALLSAFHRMSDIDGTLYNNHKLPPLASRAAQVLQKLFPEDPGIRSIADDLKSVTQDFSEIDESSFAYRYPMQKDGSPVVAQTQNVDLAGLSSRMNGILDRLEVLDFGLDLETEEAQDIYQILESLVSQNDGA
jgi:hypothetical protein